MSFVKIYGVVGLLLVGGYFLKGTITSRSPVTASKHGFVDVPWVTEAEHNQVLIIGPPCADIQRQMNAMVTALAAQHIPAKTTSEIRFAQGEVEEQKMAAARTVFESDAPIIVFINGRAKSNPSVQEVIGEYQLSVAKLAK